VHFIVSKLKIAEFGDVAVSARGTTSVRASKRLDVRSKTFSSIDCHWVTGTAMTNTNTTYLSVLTRSCVPTFKVIFSTFSKLVFLRCLNNIACCNLKK